MKTHSLQRQLTIWTVLLVVVPSTLIMAVYTFGEISAARRQSLEMLNQRVAAQERLIDYWMNERIHDVRIISQAKAFRAMDTEAMNESLQDAQRANLNFDSLSYIDSAGVFKMSTLSGGIKFPSAVGRPYYEEAVAGREFISDIVTGRNSGQQIINFSAPVYDYAGTFRGLILGSIRTATLETLLRDNWVGQTGEIFLINRDGLMLTEPRFADELVARGLIQGTAKMQYKLTGATLQRLQPGSSGQGAWIDYLGTRVLGAHLYVPERGWTLIGKINETEVLAPVYAQLASMAGATVLLVLLVLPMASRLIDRIKRPIEWLSRQAGMVRMENYVIASPGADLKNMPDEVATLCATFVDMSRKIGDTIKLLKENEAKLAGKVIEIQDINAALEEEVMERQAAQAALQQLNAELETRVWERTSELQRLNDKLHWINDALTVSKTRYRALFDHMLNAFNVRKVIVNSAGRPVDLEYVDVNPAYEEMFGLRAADVVGRRITEIFPGFENEPFNWLQMLGDVALTGQPAIVEEYFAGRDKWLRLEAYSPEKGFVAAVMQDITDNKRSDQERRRYADELAATNQKLVALNEELQRISLADGLTGIANRRYFDEYAAREWQRAMREKKPLALAMIDVDFFKAYNDTYGHLAGDECLKTIAGLLQALPRRAADLAARFGGEEFALVLPDTDTQGAATVGETVRAGVENLAIEHARSSVSRFVTISVGVAVAVPDQDTSWSDIVAAADRALYRAKQGGRNRVAVAAAAQSTSSSKEEPS